ncbi:MAG: AMP-binding protein, partial [Sanguibacteroides justesenii]|nr:AMP-binding protein [Sanguibacteroides justesenii]
MNIRLNGKRYTDLNMLPGNIDPEVIAFLQEWYNEKEEVIGHTSGSTGKPKEIRLLKKDMIASASLTNEYFHIGPQSRLLLCLSPTYIAGKMMIVRTILSGADLITIKPTSSPLQNIEDDIDFAAMVPMQVETTLANPETRSRFARIKQVIIGGAAVS